MGRYRKRDELLPRCSHVYESGRRCGRLAHATGEHSLFSSYTWCEACEGEQVTKYIPGFCSKACKQTAEQG